MEIHLYGLSWNDADMLPFFFRHYDPVVSRYFFFDDHSTDGTLELLHSHPNVEVQPFVRSDPDSLVLSLQSICNEFWKHSRGLADWVIVTDIDEHLFHPDLPALLTRYKALGITIIPALGYQMISEEFPRWDELLCETRTRGAPWDVYSRVSVFDPSAITEIDYSVGGHVANPTGRVIAPSCDELLLLHYKFLGFKRTHARHQQQRSGLGRKDLENGWAYQYRWSKEEFMNIWSEFSRISIDVRKEAAVANYPMPQHWWDPFRSLATMAAELRRASLEKKEARRELRRMEELIESSRLSLESERSSKKALQSEVAALRNDLQGERSRRSSMEHSWSWKVTKPMRSFGHILGLK